MFASVRALLAGVIDYAGLFPPAKLPLDQAIRNYARYRQEPEGWMLGRFVCPATRLADLGPYREELFDSGPPFEFSVLGRGGDSPDQFLAGFRADLQAVTSFQEYHADRVQVDAIEVRLPPDVVRLENFDPATELLASAADILDSWGGALTPYYEPPLGSNWRQELNAAQGVVLCGHIQDEIKGRLPRRSAGLKLRCGGLEVSAFPPPELVADAITSCRDLGMNLKFTAGLHHPIRRYDAAVNTKSPATNMRRRPHLSPRTEATISIIATDRV